MFHVMYTLIILFSIAFAINVHVLIKVGVHLTRYVENIVRGLKFFMATTFSKVHVN